jgi:hypothetical protein
MITKDFIKSIRNNKLKESDHVIADYLEQGNTTEANRWVTYRNQLRDFFDDKPENFNYQTDLVWPRTPYDIDALHEKASQGDQEAIEIIQKDGL